MFIYKAFGWALIMLGISLQVNGQRMRGSRPLEVVPFRFDGSPLLLSVTVNQGSDTLHFLFDSGCEVNVLSKEQSQKLGLKSRRDAGVSGWSKEMTMLPQAQARSINIGSLSIPYPDFYLEDLGGAVMQGIRVDGVLGYDLLRRYVVKIDFQHREMSIYRSGFFRYPPGGELLKLGMNYKTPTVEASLDAGAGQVLVSTYHVITGGNFGLLLNGEYVKKYDLDSKLHQTGAVTRQDLLQPVTYMQCVVPAFSLGKDKLSGIPALYSPKVNDGAPDKEIAGAIGAAVWRHFTLIINLPGKALYLIPERDGKSDH